MKEQQAKFTPETIISWLEDIALECEAITWYRVAEKLPDKHGVYLVTLNNFNTDFCEYYPDDGKFGWKNNFCDEVTAWANLPKPCKE